MRSRTMISLALIGAILSAGSPAVGEAQPGDLKLQVGKATLQSLLNASVPYKTEVGAGLLRESLTFSQPRDLSLGDGKITFAVRCQGSPFPIDQILHPVFSFRPGAQGYHLTAESLPVAVTGFGRIDLKDLFPPVDLQGLLRQGLNLSGRPTLLELRIERIDVAKESIEFSARLLLTPQASP
jgi:hypothetical protein